MQELEQYNPADVAMSLCRMISYNIGQLAYLNAKRWVAGAGQQHWHVQLSSCEAQPLVLAVTSNEQRCLTLLPACRYNLSRIFFGGFFIRGHPYTMETISFAIRFWSKVTGTTLHTRHAPAQLVCLNLLLYAVCCTLYAALAT